MPSIDPGVSTSVHGTWTSWERASSTLRDSTSLGFGRWRRLAEGQHQPVGPVEESRAVDHVHDFQVVEPSRTQRLDLLVAKRDRRVGQRDRRRDDRVPAAVDIRFDTFVEKPLNVGTPLGMLRLEPGMDGGTEDAAIGA